MAIAGFSVFDCPSGQPSTKIDWCDLVSLIEKAFEAGNLALLVGSGVSQFAPASVPPGEKIVKRLMNLLLSTYPEEFQYLTSKIEYSTNGIPFEVLMARMSELDADLAREIVVKLTRIANSYQSNLLHCQIRRLFDIAASRDLALPVVTSNYDTGISDVQQIKIFSSLVCSIPDIVITEDQLRQAVSTREIFHIHGATTVPESLVFDYKQEFKLEQWKRKHLQAIMQNKLVLILGFSGKDLDICRALADCNLQGVIWFRSTKGTCDPENWTLDAQNLVKKAIPSYSVNTQGILQYALAELLHDDLATVSDVEVDSEEIKSRFDEVIEAYPIQLRLWARWMGLRAGFWPLAQELTDSERSLLSEQQILEIEAFGCYYAGRHLSGARLLHQAGREAIQADKPTERLARYLYFCNTEVEYLNRGAFTVRALVAALRTSLVVLWRIVIHHDKWTPEAWDEYKNLLGSLTTIWPLFPILLSSSMLGTWPSEIIRPVLRWLLQMEEGADLDKFITIRATMSTPDSQEFREAQEQYRWLGQQARQINLYRTSALRQLHMLYALPYNKSKTNLEKLKEIYKLADQSASWAQNIGDPCRTAKSKLVCLEVLKAITDYNPDSIFMSSLPNESHILSSDGSPLISSEDAWAELSQGEVSPWCSFPTHTLYKFVAHGTRVLHRRLRLLTLSFLETS